MKIAYIATYPPRECGIGTYTQNKFRAVHNYKISKQEVHKGIVIAMNDDKNTYEYPEEVKFLISQDQQIDYIDAARFINESGADICVLEHEFGIFGGQDGSYILSLLHQLKIPVIAVLHTVLKAPSYNQRAITTEISRMAAKTVVMSYKAVEFLTKVYGIDSGRIEIVEHGVPELQFNQETVKRELNLETKKVLLTFGLISRNKGIETVLKALPPVVAKYPETIYIILGKTHPSVVRHSGEEYRFYLERLVKELKLEGHVLFINEFIDQNDLVKFLSAADIYVTPYLNEAQITSGTLSYAVGAGCAVVSTPYWHAVELLSEGRGRLFNFNDYKQLSSIFMELLDHPQAMDEMSNKASAYGRKITWPMTGQKYIKLAKTILLQHQELGEAGKKEVVIDPLLLPPFSLDHIKRMTDGTGLFQHAKFGIPNLKEGYCIDDNARGLLMVLMAYKQENNSQAVELMRIYLGFIHYMQNDNGTFRNFLSFSRNFLDDVGSEDSFGRTIWALGYLIGNAPNDTYLQFGREMFLKASPNFEKLQYVRGIADTIIGISYYLQGSPSNIEMVEKMRHLSYKLIDKYNVYSTESWKWFEPVLTYDNAVMPLSLLHAGEILMDEKIINTAIESMHFISGITLKNEYLSIIGNEKWYAKDSIHSMFAQQPIDAMMMVLMFQKAYLLTKDETYLDNLYTSYMWFLGENDLRMKLYDHETKGCFDGLEFYGVNQNQGAESTLAYLISHLALSETFENKYDTNKEIVKPKNTDFVKSNT